MNKAKKSSKTHLNINQTKAFIMNMFIESICIIPCFYPAQKLWGLDTARGYGPIISLLIITFVNYKIFRSKQISPFAKMNLLIACHLAYTCSVLYVCGNNSIMFSILSISQIIVLLSYDTHAIVFQLAVFEIYSIIMWFISPLFIANRFLIDNYIFCMVGLGAQTFIFKYIIENHREKVKSEKELIHTSDDLIKVVERKCEDATVATKSKSEFLANMSHEIRTPINAVLGLNEMVLRESSEQDILGYAHDIKSAGTQLLNIINDVLDFSKIESGKMDILPVSYDISSVLNDLVNMINVKANDKGLSFKLSVDSTIPRILVGDEVRIKQIITNILTNAVKYTEEGYVELNVSYEKIERFAIILHVAVKDTGMGMKEEDLNKLFSPFERMEETRNRHVEGTGLGMSITKTFLELMGSKLEVESTYGEGSTFSFAVRQEVENWECMADYEEAFKRLRNKTEIYIPSLYAPRAHILVVDDMPMNISVFKGLLKQTGIQIDDTNSGYAAIELCRENKYDVIFLDHMMPDLDGIETHKLIASDDEGLNRDTPIIILTANAISGSRDTYLSHGFDDYMSKPIDPEKLEKNLIRFLPEDVIDVLKDSITDKEEENYDDILSELKNIESLHVDEAVAGAGGPAIYISIINEFLMTVEKRASMVSEYLESKDIRNYTIQVHGLKSTLRLIGEYDLSEVAKLLEDAGNAENMDYISETTPAFLEEFYSVADKLKPIIFDDENDEDLPLIDDVSLTEMLEVMKQGAIEFDFDLVESVMSSMSEYRMPDDFKDIYRKIKVAMAEVDFDSISNLIEGYK